MTRALGCASLMLALASCGDDAAPAESDAALVPDAKVDIFVDATPTNPGARKLTISSSVHDFGDVVIGTPSATTVFTITSSGTRRVAPIAAQVSGSPDFSLVADLCTGQTLEPGMTCTVSVRITPTGAPGARQGSLTVLSNVIADVVGVSAGLSANAVPAP